jgi:MOSC domain-containing protein YiiM
MRVASVNISPILTVAHHGKQVRTAIYKQPISGRLLLAERGFRGDEQADKRHHGRPTQAAYAFSAAEYPYWNGVLGRFDLVPGRFGENLTIEGLDDAAVCIGDIYRLGDARVQVTFPRLPCSTLAMALDDTAFPKAFLARMRTGPYLRVLSEGDVGAGDAMTLEWAHPARLSIVETVHLLHFEKNAAARWREASEIVEMDEEVRAKFEVLLSKSEGGGTAG